MGVYEAIFHIYVVSIPSELPT